MTIGWRRLEVWYIFLACYLLPIASLRWQLPSIVTSMTLKHPIQMLLFAFFLPVLPLIFTPPCSPLRMATIPLLAVIIISYLQTADSYISNKSFIAMSSGPTTLLLFSSIDYLVLQRLHLTADGTEKTLQPGVISESKDKEGEWIHHYLRKAYDVRVWKWAYQVIFSYRAIGTPRQVKHMPQWSKTDPEYAPSRGMFLLQRGSTVLGAYLVLDFLNSQPAPDLAPFSAIKAGQFSGLSGQNFEDLLARMVSTAVFWTSLRLTIALIYNSFGLLPVALMIDSPKDWPPYFGSILSAYSIRQFWGVYWQHSLRNMLVGNAKFWTHGVLRQKKGTIVARYLNVTFSFVLSGLLHTVLDVCGGVPRNEARTWVFFVLQAVGIMIEDAVEALYCCFTTGKKSAGSSLDNCEAPRARLQTWHKIVGYVWLYFFMVWTTPAWSYSIARHADPVNNYILPFSVSPWAGKPMKGALI